MATATCGTFQIRHGTFPSIRSTSSRGIGSTISFDLYSVASRRNVEGRNKKLVLSNATTDDRVEMDENPEGIISGEWPENFSLLCYDDLRAYLETQILEEDVSAKISIHWSRLFLIFQNFYPANQETVGSYPRRDVHRDSNGDGGSKFGGNRAPLRICFWTSRFRLRTPMRWRYFQV